MQALAARLAEYSKIVLISGLVEIEPGLFLKFPACAFEVRFAKGYEAFRHRPSTGFFLRPIGSSRVDEKHLCAGIPPSK